MANCEKLHKPNYLLETHFAELGRFPRQVSKSHVFETLATNLKQNGKRQKSLETSEMGIWRGVERGVAGFKVKNAKS